MKIDPAKITSRKEMHDVMTAMIMPRPIAWVSTVDAKGVYNIAPFSFFSCASVMPPVVCFSIGRKRDGGKKDTLVNIEASKEFVVNIVDEGMAQAMNQTAAEYPPDVDEFEAVRLTAAKGDVVGAPLLAESPMSMECTLHQIMTFGDGQIDSCLVLGRVVRVHVRDELYAGGQVDSTRLRLVGRLGGESFYCRTGDRFQMERPPKP